MKSMIFRIIVTVVIIVLLAFTARVCGENITVENRTAIGEIN